MLIRSCAALLALSLSSSVFAGAIYSYEVNSPSGSDNAGDIKNIQTTYDNNNEKFSWSYTIGKNSMGDYSDGFWLVVTDGENPKNDANEYAILYGDTDTNRLTAYEYSGQNNANSYSTPGNLLASFDNVFSVDTDLATMERTVSFDIDASDINDGNGVENPGMWKGLNFASKIGVWFHASTQTLIGYANKEITSFGYDKQGWHDVGNKTTTEVPEPGVFALLAIGMIGLRVARKRAA